MESLFDDNTNEEVEADAPLATRMRPCSLDAYVGQSHILAPGKPLYEALKRGRMHSMVLFGPPGVGKTTLAHMMARCCSMRFVMRSAIFTHTKELRAFIEQAVHIKQTTTQKTVLFIDEIHRFNRAEQDVFLPYVENGTLILVGATTENPSFELNRALLSRVRIYPLKPLSQSELALIIERALSDVTHGLGALKLQLSTDERDKLIAAADGDARRLLNLLEQIAAQSEQTTTGRYVHASVWADLFSSQFRQFDKGQDIFYDQISALHKSVRGSDPDAALYWLVRMLDGGADPLYVGRRLVRMASEDIGNAEPHAMTMALSALEIQERLGQPEGALALAQVAVYLACAPKSNAVYVAFKRVSEVVKNSPSYAVPAHLCQAVTPLLSALGKGQDYRYPHDEKEAYVAGEKYLPDALLGQRYYEPVPRGVEIKIKEKLAHLRALDASVHEA